MTHPALRQLFEDDFQETVEAIATPLRLVSSHAAEMVHSQLLSDTATICESMLLLLQDDPAQRTQGTNTFTAYLQRRRSVGFDDVELHAIVSTCRRVLLKLLTSLPHEKRQDAARKQLEDATNLLDGLITSTYGGN